MPDDGEQLRVAYNIAVSAGDERRALQLRHELVRRLHPIRIGQAAGLALLGWEWLDGVAPRLRVYVVATGPTTRPWRVEVTSLVTERPWSTVPPPDAIRQVGMPFALPTTIFRPGFI